jgi:uncharacterized membrane protein
MAKRKKPASHRAMPVRMVQLHGKLIGAALLGILVAVAFPSSFDPSVRELAGWNVGVALYLVLTHTMMSRCAISSIKQRAAEEDEGGFAILLLSIAATVASFVAIVFLLGNAKEAEALEATLDSLLAMSTIILSWTFVHTIFALHYAHEYYGERGDGTVGGLKFPGNEDPDYWDFFYFSLVIGMTSQVSDVAITSRYIRRMATAHGILSFFFNVAVLALTVNTLAGLVEGK